jgi:hypothetical protein
MPTPSLLAVLLGGLFFCGIAQAETFAASGTVTGTVVSVEHPVAGAMVVVKTRESTLSFWVYAGTKLNGVSTLDDLKPETRVAVTYRKLSQEPAPPNYSGQATAISVTPGTAGLPGGATPVRGTLTKYTIQKGLHLLVVTTDKGVVYTFVLSKETQFVGGDKDTVQRESDGSIANLSVRTGLKLLVQGQQITERGPGEYTGTAAVVTFVTRGRRAD